MSLRRLGGAGGDNGRVRRWRGDREPGFTPGLEAAVKIRGAVKAQRVQAGGGQTGRVARVAEDDHLLLDTRRPRMAVVTAGSQAPLEDVARDHQRARDRAVAEDLTLSSDVDHDRPIAACRSRRARIQPGQAGPGAGQQLLEAHGAHFADCTLTSARAPGPEITLDQLRALLGRRRAIRAPGEDPAGASACHESPAENDRQ